jgi:hypothetical protein
VKIHITVERNGKVFGVDIEPHFDDLERLPVEDFITRYIEPAFAYLKNEVKEQNASLS